MPLLKLAFEEIGFLNVSTYINSGNILFSTNENDRIKLIDLFQSIIYEKFLLNIPVTIVSLNELSDILENTPKWWDINSDKEIINQVIFLIPPTTIEEVYKAVGEEKLEYEKVRHYKMLYFGLHQGQLCIKQDGIKLQVLQ